MKNLILAAIDPALSNFGLARASYDLATGEITPLAVALVSTEARDKKTVRKNSDDLRRASESFVAMQDWIAGATVVFAEVPTGTQSARGALSNGVCIGILSSIGNLPYVSGPQARMIQVSPIEVKLASVGSKTASKQDMIDWAVSKAPKLGWITHRHKLTAANEHPADALAAIYAGVKTEEFRALVATLRNLFASEAGVSSVK